MLIFFGLIEKGGNLIRKRGDLDPPKMIEKGGNLFDS
jgi:hypothetical protein